MNINQIITSKTLISTLIYLPVPLVLLAMALVKPVSSPFILFIPFLVILAVASAIIFEIQLFLSYVTKGKIAAIIHDLKKLVVGVTALVAPLIVYSLTYVTAPNHVLAILSVGAVTALELALAMHLLKRNIKLG